MSFLGKEFNTDMSTFVSLQMTGSLIEDAEKDENDGKAEKMDKIFEKIKELLDGGTLSR